MCCSLSSRWDLIVHDEQQLFLRYPPWSCEGGSTGAKMEEEKVSAIRGTSDQPKKLWPQKDKRFSGTVRLKSTPRPKFSVCILGDQQHCDEAKTVDLPHMDTEALKKLNKNKKLVKKLAKKYEEIWCFFGLRITYQADICRFLSTFSQCVQLFFWQKAVRRSMLENNTNGCERWSTCFGGGHSGRDHCTKIFQFFFL